MIRIKKIIPKDKLWEYVADTNISRIDIPTSLNRALSDPLVCKVLIYVKDTPECERAPEGRMHGIFTMIRKQLKLTANSSDHGFLTGLMAQKNLGWLKESQINKLYEIQQRDKVDLNILKKLIDIIKKYK